MATEAQERAAARVANTIKAMLLEMLTRGEFGEVAVIVLDPYHLKPVKRVETEGTTVKVSRGVATVIERVG